jgi:hypothetical protein
LDAKGVGGFDGAEGARLRSWRGVMGASVAIWESAFGLGGLPGLDETDGSGAAEEEGGD